MHPRDWVPTCRSWLAQNCRFSGKWAVRSSVVLRSIPASLPHAYIGTSAPFSSSLHKGRVFLSNHSCTALRNAELLLSPRGFHLVLHYAKNSISSEIIPVSSSICCVLALAVRSRCRCSQDRRQSLKKDSGLKACYPGVDPRSSGTVATCPHENIKVSDREGTLEYKQPTLQNIAQAFGRVHVQ